MIASIAEIRLKNQRLQSPGLRRPEDVVAWFGAIQAQEYDTAKWAIAIRMRGRPVDATIERAFNEGRVLRTHVMRPTWHFVTPRDIRWLLELTGARVQRAMSTYNTHVGLDAQTLRRGTSVVEAALGDGRHLTRLELSVHLARAGIAMTSLRLAGVVMNAELEGVICSGPRKDRQFTYSLLAERAPKAERLSRDEALATLARRFLQGHAPATVRDFVWWSGLITADAKRALDIIAARPQRIADREYWTTDRTGPRGAARDQLVHLLPIYDEYLVAYRDRHPVPHGSSKVVSRSRGPVNFQHALVIAGRVAGTWRTTRRAGAISVHVVPSRRLNARERRALTEELHQFEKFLPVPASISID